MADKLHNISESFNSGIKTWKFAKHTGQTTNCSFISDYASPVVCNTVGYVSLIILTFGTIGNIAVIGILSRKQMPRSNITPYLLCLLVVDLLAIWGNYPRIIVKSVPFFDNRKIFQISNNFTYVVFVINIYSSWLTVVISMERLLAIYSPFSRRISPKPCIPYMVMSILLCCDCIIHAIIILLLKDHVHIFLALIVIYSFVPAVFLIISSIFMIYKLLKRPNLGQNLQRNTSTRPRKSIYIVVTINIIFLLTTLPVSIYYFIMKLNGCIDNKIYLLLDTLACANNSLNFIMYFVASKIFRKNLKQICCKKMTNRKMVYMNDIQPGITLPRLEKLN